MDSNNELLTEVSLSKSKNTYQTDYDNKMADDKNPKSINKNILILPDMISQSQFFNFLIENYKCIKDELQRDNYRNFINSMVIIMENKYILNRICKYNIEKNVLSFNFFVRGKSKEIVYKVEKLKKFNCLEYLFNNYSKFFSAPICEEKILITKDINEGLYNLTGFPILDYEFNNKNPDSIFKIVMDLKKYVENENMIVLLIKSDNIESIQYAYYIASTYQLNNTIKINQYISDSSQSSISTKEIKDILFKLMAMSQNTCIRTNYSERVLMDSNKDINYISELYPNNNSNNYSWISISEIMTIFDRIIVMENMLYEQQINGKFIYCVRNDDIVEYKSKWIYSFNIKSDYAEIIVGIHQPQFNFSTIKGYIYVGLVILKSNNPFLALVDYMPLKDIRQNFIKLKLIKGSYVIVPITSGFYFDQGDMNLKTEGNFELFYEKKDLRSNKKIHDFTFEAKFIIDEIFDKYDINRHGELDYEIFKIFYNYIDPNNNDAEKVFNDFSINKKLSNKEFRNIFFNLFKLKGKKFIYDVFTLFGYEYIQNNKARHFFLTFHSNEVLNITMSDGLNNKFNSYAFELYLKHVGAVIFSGQNNKILLIYDTTYDSTINILLLENQDDNEKKVTLEIDSNGYLIHNKDHGYQSLNNYSYNTLLKPKERKYLFPIAINRYNAMSSININYHIIITE